MMLRPTEIPRLPGVHTLVLEDDAFLRDGVSDLLELEGADVASAATGHTGFARFLHDCPDVIVSDLSMPDGSGYDFIEHVRELPPERGGLTPAIAVSAIESTGKALMAGFQRLSRQAVRSTPIGRDHRRLHEAPRSAGPRPVERLER